MTNPPPYNNFGLNAQYNGGPLPNEPHRLKRYAAFICGIVQLCLACMMITVGIIKDAALFPSMGVHAFIGGLLTIFAGAFGIQYSRSGNRCPTIASMVLSILASIIMFSGFVMNSAYVAVSEAHVERGLQLMIDDRQISPNDRDSLDIARLTIEHAFQGAAEACFSLMIFACLINFITCIVQSALACGIVCECCKSVMNTNAYITNPAPAAYPAPGAYPAQQHSINTEQQPQAGYDVNMGHMATNA